MNLKVRLTAMNFLEFAVWGAYLTSMGRYLGEIGLGANIGFFYSIQGIVSLFMPAIIGIVADRWVQAQKMLGYCHLMAGGLMVALAWYCMTNAQAIDTSIVFSLYSLSVAFYMPTLALSNSVAFNALQKAGMDMVKDFPPIRVFGTVGFIIAMWFVDIMDFEASQMQFMTSGVLGIILFLYSFTLPKCEVSSGKGKNSFAEAFGLKAFSLFKQKKMALFFLFSMMLGVSLQITNGFANPFIASFASMPEYADTFGVRHTNILLSLSQISEACCILLIPFFMKRFGIKNVMLIAMMAWVLRFGLFALGNPGDGVWMFVLSMLVYGVAFDFFNISGAFFVDMNTDTNIRSSAQGLFMLVTNGIGATIGTLAAQWVVNQYTTTESFGDNSFIVGDWSTCWFVFAAYSLFVAISFALVFKPVDPNK
ncbi:MFS transporter [Prevotella sp. P2-180]|uniref:MFS transporter n=1 Tax=Prevotella sp. P2-180 TaxID=2024224 RepID=UPI000B971E22|nr:MFS transporter [Prevotella sp. P2-180]OYP67278.1 MFS transporter [Prevotella sp. P2-180]